MFVEGDHLKLLFQSFEQLSLALDRTANRIWVINVGDLKPYELNTEFFLSYAWDSSPWNYDNLDTFVSSWAQREFDVNSGTANEIADIITNLTRWNNRRKPELLNGTTYSLTDYREYGFKIIYIPMRWLISKSELRWSSMTGKLS